MPYKDKEKQKICNRECHKRWYKKYRKAARAKIEQRKREIKEWFWIYKCGLKCNRCPETHPATIDFHHKGNKDRGVSVLVNQGVSKEKILAEISKCEVLCSNCHRKEHCERAVVPLELP